MVHRLPTKVASPLDMDMDRGEIGKIKTVLIPNAELFVKKLPLLTDNDIPRELHSSLFETQTNL